MQKYGLALDLKDDPALIAEYERLHQAVKPEILKSFTDAGIINMEIYRSGNRLFMVLETDDSFSFERKAAMDAANPKVQAWEAQVGELQQALPWATPGEKWVLMENIFRL